MHLPTPTAAEVAQFRALYRDEFGVNLDSAQALDKLITLLHASVLLLTVPPDEAAGLPSPITSDPSPPAHEDLRPPTDGPPSPRSVP